MIQIVVFENAQDTQGKTITAKAGQSLMKAALTTDKTANASLDASAVAFSPSVADMPEKLITLLRDGDVLITMGAGSISGLPHALAEAKHA